MEIDRPSSDDAPGGDHVVALHASPDRVVFVEDGNHDGWIATDLTIGLAE